MAQQQQPRKRITPQLVQPAESPGAGANSAGALGTPARSVAAWRIAPAVAPSDPDAVSQLGPARRIYVDMEAYAGRTCVVDFKAVRVR